MDIFLHVMYDSFWPGLSNFKLSKLDSLSHETSLIIPQHKKVSECTFQIHLLHLISFSCNSLKYGCG